MRFGEFLCYKCDLQEILSEKCENARTAFKSVQPCFTSSFCILGVYGWDFNLISSKDFVKCVRRLNTLFAW